MPTSVVMPQMGESIAEGTIVRWIKRVGDQVERDEPLFEISTDKVDAEIPSPAAGILTDIKVREGETVGVNTVVATIGQPNEVRGAGGPVAPAAARQQADGESTSAPTPADKTVSSITPERPSGNGRRRSSPLVRRIAKDHNVDIAQIQGSGIGGRVTKHDILDYLQEGRLQPAATPASTPAPPEPVTRAPQVARPAGADRVEKMSVMRKKIAEHMILSRRTSAHVYSVFHVNFSTIETLRQQKKAEYEQRGAKLTYMAFIARAIAGALSRHPVINASIDGENVVYRKDINLGIAVALDEGLIVPVVKNADEKNLLGLSRAIADVAERARSKRLNPDEVHGGTFTITNPGQFGAQFGMPIINQPQVAILGVGTIEKRPVVVDDAIGIRTMAYLTLGYDHRLVDGAVADQFMADVKEHLECFDPADC
ncbi:MAG TPA: dihydrolipoamide acetyltransferase family protein [Vicinamibacterales bacterium]|nr:dihydrolipoamide acetyltransferase family protein [Vicinamibacterales bacterium]